jgi:hypothetical protein
MINADFGTLLTVSVTVIGLTGGAVGYFGKSRGDSIIKYQIARLEKDNSALHAENNLLKDQNAKLSDLAQGNPQLKALTAAVETLTTVINAKLGGKP